MEQKLQDKSKHQKHIPGNKAGELYICMQDFNSTYQCFYINVFDGNHTS